MLVDEITKRMNGDRKKINKSRSTVDRIGENRSLHAIILEASPFILKDKTTTEI
jgi:hypothetical protein